MTQEMKLALEKKAIKLQKEVTEILDKLYEVDELFADEVKELLQDESFIRS